MTSISGWEDLDTGESLPVASPEVLRLIPPFHAERDAKCLVILPNAVFDEIMRHLKGDCTTERIGMLVGHPCTRPSTEQLLVYVDAALPVDDRYATRTKVSIQKSGWKEVWKDLVLAPGNRIVGWYHSHPNHGVFLSAVDRTTQSLWFAQEWKVAIVVDPVRGEHQAFTGANGIATPIVFV
jgi:proteasome lid subunit RPN8/RPN11